VLTKGEKLTRIPKNYSIQLGLFSLHFYKGARVPSWALVKNSFPHSFLNFLGSGFRDFKSHIATTWWTELRFACTSQASLPLSSGPFSFNV
jgi:hypothetical protein